MCTSPTNYEFHDVSVSFPAADDYSSCSRIAIDKLIHSPSELENYKSVDITHLLQLPQTTAAQRLGIAQSTLSRRYYSATGKIWPYREVSKIDREIAELISTNFNDEVTLMKIKTLKIRKARLLFPVTIYL